MRPAFSAPGCAHAPAETTGSVTQMLYEDARQLAHWHCHGADLESLQGLSGAKEDASLITLS